MAGIGATLREARTRQRTDISDVEAQTKIRAKYLRALENEEWDLLPGPTFVKSFLRTYADALGLDGRALVEEYRMRFERLSDAELLPIAMQTARERERAAKRASRPGVKRDVLVAALIVSIVALLIVLGRGGDDDTPAPRAVDTGAGGATTTARPARTTTTPTAPPRVRLRLNPTTASGVYVCLRAGDGVLIDKQTLTPATPKRTYRARAFRLLVGNSNLTLTINGKRRTIEPSPEPSAFAITTKGRRAIDADPDKICS